MTESGSLAVCGGRWAGKPFSSDCLVLNTTSNQWERGLLGNVLGAPGDIIVGVISMKNIGTYMIHQLSSSFLPSGEREWKEGPSRKETVIQCATRISDDKFLALSSKSVSQFDSRTGPLNNEGWSADWPESKVERYRPGCATVHAPEHLCVVAGGRNAQYELLNSVEIIFISSKSRGQAKDMLRPRSHFNLIGLGPILVAFGGNDETLAEIWEGVEEPWKEAPISLANSRSQFSAIASTDSVCSAGSLPPHTCPTVGGGTCVFPFTKGKFMFYYCPDRVPEVALPPVAASAGPCNDGIVH